MGVISFNLHKNPTREDLLLFLLADKRNQAWEVKNMAEAHNYLELTPGYEGRWLYTSLSTDSGVEGKLADKAESGPAVFDGLCEIML